MSDRRSPRHPPRPRLALRVGVTGHRHDDLVPYDEDAIRASVRSILKRIQAVFASVAEEGREFFAGEPPVLRMISRLADGTDLLVAEEAVRLGFDLQCPLPFARDEYLRHDIDAPWKKAYEDALAGASAVLELDGERLLESIEAKRPGTKADRSVAFFDGRRTVLRNTDVLIAVVDPNAQSKSGLWGTDQILREARRDDILTVRINPAEPEVPELDLCEGDLSVCTVEHDRLEQSVRRVLLPPGLRPRDETREGGLDESVADNDAAEAEQARELRAYLDETEPRWTLGFLWLPFRDLVADRKLVPPRMRLEPIVPPAEETSRPEADGACAVVEREVGEHVDLQARWADGLANYYSNLTRSAYLFNYLMGAAAVFLALVGYAAGWTDHHHPWHAYEWVPIALELAAILAIVANTVVGNRRRWAERWIEYRLLGEQLRLLRYLAPLGRVNPHTRLPPHLTFGDPRSGWGNWLFRATVRSLPLVDARVDEQYVEDCRATLLDFVTGQAQYHGRQEHRFEHLHHRMHRAGLTLFVATGVACAVHLFVHEAWLTFLAAGLPALGAALAGISGQLQLERVAKRSRSMHEVLQRIEGRLEGAGVVPSREVGQIGEDVATVVSQEVLDWRSLLHGGEIPLPA